MGLFTNFLRMADDALQAIEDGAIEQTLTGAVDMLEQNLDKVTNSAEKVATSPEKLLQKADKTAAAVEEKMQVIGLTHDEPSER